MKLPNDKPKKQIEVLKSLLPIGKDVIVTLGNHDPNHTHFVDCYLSTQNGIKENGGNLPDKRDNKTPSVVTIELFDGKKREYLDLVVEDIDYTLNIGGITFDFSNYTLVIKEQ